MLYDKDFLLKLDKNKHKVIYARITALTFQETPIEYIEGRVTQGSINLDGASAVRRTCSLTIAAPEFNYNDYYWGLNTKFKLEIGVQNNIDPQYPKIIWFKQGTYLITSFNTSRNTTNFTISIQGKDKMCLLNGEVGGSLESSVDFGTIEEEDSNGLWTIKKVPIQDIIKNIVHVYGGEPYYNIIINDLDTYGFELLEYRYDTPIFLYRKPNDTIYTNGIIGGTDVSCRVHFSDGRIVSKLVSELEPMELENMVDSLINIQNPPLIEVNGEFYTMAKIEYGQTAGYRKTDLVYAGDLIAKVGESITSVLDKIKNMLTEFEYFYNLDGQFVFQKKQSFKETIWQFDEDKMQQELNEGIALSSEHAYEFHGSDLITTFNNNPNLLNVRNDYSIWGEREGVSGVKIPIHLRYAIDKKPKRYNKIFVDYGTEDNPGADFADIEKYNNKYNTLIRGQESVEYLDSQCDWREIIYQMALDYYRYNFLDDFELKVAAANPIDYPTGRTGYEQYYIDLQGFWRQLYYPNVMNLFTKENNEFVPTEVITLRNEIEALSIKIYGTPTQDLDAPYTNNTGGIENDLIVFTNAPKASEKQPGDTHKTKEELIVEWNSSREYDFRYDNGYRVDDPDVYLGFLNDYYFREKNKLDTKKYQLQVQLDKYVDLNPEDYYPHSDDTKLRYWNKQVFEAPEQLNFWFDFLDTTGELQQFSVKSIGSRSKTINDTNIKSIYFRETPMVVYRRPGDPQDNEAGFRYIQAPDLDHMFTCSAQGKSAKDKFNELIYQHGYCIESATINTIPIYYLEPNTRIYVHDEETGLDGDYIVSKLTIPLAYNGTMSITATKAAENIL